MDFIKEHLNDVIALGPRTECLETPIHDPTKERYVTEWGSSWTNTKIEVDETRQS